MNRWLKLTVPRFNKWYNRWYYRIFHPEIQRWLDHCAREIEEGFAMGKFQQPQADLSVYGWGPDDCKEGE